MSGILSQEISNAEFLVTRCSVIIGKQGRNTFNVVNIILRDVREFVCNKLFSDNDIDFRNNKECVGNK